MISLSPLVGRVRKPKPFGVYDLEASKWINFLIVGFYDGHTYKSFLSMHDFLEYIFTEEHPAVDIYAHFGGKYDVNFLILALLSYKGRLNFKIMSMVPRGSSIFSVEVFERTTLRTLVFRDSSALLSFSLNELCKKFDVEHKKLEINYEDMTEVTPEVETYLEHDCRGLHQVIEKFRATDIIEDAGVAHTIASQAMRVFRRFLQEDIPSLTEQEDEFVRECYFGGRTEIFKPVYDGRKGKIYGHDVNSLYPYIMKSCLFPTTPIGFTKKYDPNVFGFFNAYVEVPEDMYVPPLPVVKKVGKSNKLIFPTGRFWGRWSTAELEYARSLGVKILETGMGLTFKPGRPIFYNFVSTLYKMRLEAQNRGDLVLEIILKLILNSTYGKFGINRVKENIVLDDLSPGLNPFAELNVDGECYRLAKQEVKLDKSFSNVAVAAWVTSNARIHIHKVFRANEKDLYYGDTDSAFLTIQLESSTDLGALKVEGSAEMAAFILPKTYRLERWSDSKGEYNKIRMKGISVARSEYVTKDFSLRKAQYLTHEDFLNCLEGERMLKFKQPKKFATLKTAIGHGKLLELLDESEKEIRSRYDKRIIYKKEDGTYDTRPIHLSE